MFDYQRDYWPEFFASILGINGVLISFDYMKSFDLQDYTFAKPRGQKSATKTGFTTRVTYFILNLIFGFLGVNFSFEKHIFGVTVSVIKNGVLEHFHFLIIPKRYGTSTIATIKRLKEVFKSKRFKQIVGKRENFFVISFISNILMQYFFER